MLAKLSKRALSSASPLIEQTISGRVALLRLNRPDALNALNSALMGELAAALKKIEADDSLSCVVLTGDKKAFAAGADIAEMSEKDYAYCHKTNFLASWTDIFRFRKAMIAAVNGYALGGGFELALMCDIIYAGRLAKFGLPEIKLGTIPGGGGTQRLIRAVGKSNAMELTLTGRHMHADEAHRMGIVSRVFEESDLVDEAVKLGTEIAKYSLPAIMSCKEAILHGEELSMSSGLEYERKLFHSTFALADRKEGMQAFLQKRRPEFKNQ